jgi:alkylation response protein AidB-like acyl-CoA dehydrogenase/muconolactone delta-isomerase
MKQVLGEETVQKLQTLKQPDPKREAAAMMLEGLGREGFAKSMCLASVALPKATSAGISTFLGVNTGLAAQTISKIGTPAQQALWLNALNQGIFTYAFGLTEERIGSDPRSIETTFKKEIDPATGQTVYRLNGNKKWIGNAARVLDKDGKVVHRGADFIAVYAVDDASKPPADRTYRVFMVPRTAIGEENIRHSGRDHNKMGLREVNNGDFDLKDVIVPEALMLGQPDEDIYKKLLGLLDITRLFVGAMSLGTAEAALEAAKAYAAKRHQNGGPIEQFQAVTFPLQVLEAKAAAAKLMLMEGVRLVDLAAEQKATLEREMQLPLAAMRNALKSVQAAVEPFSQQPKLAQAKLQLQDTVDTLTDAITALEKDQKLVDAKAKLAQAIAELKNEAYYGTKGTRNLADDHPARQAAKALTAHVATLEEAAKQVAKLKEPTRFGQETAMAKLFASELAEDSIKQAINTLGGNGFSENPAQGLGLPKRFRDAKVLTIYEGTSNIQRNIISQGAFITELKRFNRNIVLGIRYYLLKNNITKRLRYRLLKDYAKTPMDRVNAAYQFAMVDAMSKYNASLQQLKNQWKAKGVPAQYQTWDAKSVDRQQNLLASLPVQARMHLVADMALYKKLMELSLDHLAVLDAKVQLTPEEAARKKQLELFIPVAEELVIQKGRELGGPTLRALEQQWKPAE